MAEKSATTNDIMSAIASYNALLSVLNNVTKSFNSMSTAGAAFGAILSTKNLGKNVSGYILQRTLLF